MASANLIGSSYIDQIDAGEQSGLEASYQILHRGVKEGRERLSIDSSTAVVAILSDSEVVEA